MNSNKKNQPDYPHNIYSNINYDAISEENSINWNKYLHLFLRNWYWFLITLGLAIGVAFFKIRYTVPQYRAKATLIIENEENSQDVVGQIRAVKYFRRQTDMANEKAKLTAFRHISRTINALNQNVYWTAHGRIRVRPIYENPEYELEIYSDSVDWFQEKEWFIDHIDTTYYRLYREGYLDTILPLNTKINIEDWIFSIKHIGNSGYETYSFVVNDPIKLSKNYKNKLKVESNETNGTVIELSSEGTVGAREVDFLNTLAKTYILSELERKQTIAENTFGFIDDQIRVILDSLSIAENQLLAFRLSNNVINISKEGEIAYERLKGFNERRTILKLQEDYYHYLKRYIEERNDPQAIIAPTLTEEGDQLLITAVQNIQQLYMDRESLEISVQENNPKIESINERIKAIRIRIIEIVNGLIENNRLIQIQIETEEQAIIRQLKALPINEQQLLNIKRKYDLYNQFYTFLLQKRAETGIQKASTISNVRILDLARNDDLVIVGIDKKLTILVAILFGLLFPIVILLLRDVLDNRIKEKEDILRKSSIPIIGVIGHSKEMGINLTPNKTNSPFTESLRRIRTNLAFTLRDKEQKVILVTSSVSGEGKTFSAANLASIFALNQRKVLLVGCDLRKPTLHRVFNISNNIGLTSFLINVNSFDEIIFPTEIQNLYCVPSGPIPPNPAELIETEEMKSFFSYAKKEFDLIIIDTPPIALVADALSLAYYANLTLFLVRQNHSHRSVLEIANSMEEEEKLPKMYLLVNDIKPSRNLGMNYYYGYGKGYEYGYYDSKYSSSKES